MDKTDLLILQKLRSGDPEAAGELVEAHARPTFRLALSILDDPAEAEEAAQEALAVALRRLDTFRCEAAFSTWLYAITLNVCRVRLRSHRRRQRIQNVLQALFRLERESPPEEMVIKRESRNQVWEALQRLGENERLAVILRYYHDLPIAQVAQVLQVSDRTVYKRLETAHARLHVLLGGKTGNTE